jgi:enamine deaminase RidA (YjgF/YER057c/UK114 family)
MREAFLLFKARNHGTLTEQIDSLAGEIKQRLDEDFNSTAGLVWSRVYFSDAANQLEVFLKHPLYGDTLSKAAFSYVQQPPLDGSKIAVKIVATKDLIEKIGTPDRCVITDGNARYLFQSVRFTAGEAARLSPYDETVEAFDRHSRWLRSEGLTLKDNCQRTWLYVRDIDVNYGGAVKGRNDVFRREGLTARTHYIASTGIGGCTETAHATVSIDFWSVDDKSMTVKYLQALDYLNPTREYGVAFERGTSFVSGGRKRLLISGTASIDKAGQCIHVGDISKQINRLFVNIDHLLSDDGATLADVRTMTVYLRDTADYAFVERYMAERFPDIPALIVYAPVCRPLWLVEVECIAVK